MKTYQFVVTVLLLIAISVLLDDIKENLGYYRTFKSNKYTDTAMYIYGRKHDTDTVIVKHNLSQKK